MLYRSILAVALSTGYVLAAPLADNRYDAGGSDVNIYKPTDPANTAPVETIVPIVSTHPTTSYTTPPATVPTPGYSKDCRNPTPPYTPPPVSNYKNSCNNPRNPSGTFFPSRVSHYDVSTGAIDYKANTSLIDKYYTNKGHDRTTLLTFTYPTEAGGRIYRFRFNLPASAIVHNSKKIDVFTSLAPAPGYRGS